MKPACSLYAGYSHNCESEVKKQNTMHAPNNSIYHTNVPLMGKKVAFTYRCMLPGGENHYMKHDTS